MSITVTINGRNEKVSRELTVAQLLQKKKVRADAVVVKLNHEIIDRGDYNLLKLKNGDKLEYLYYMGGGY